MRRDFSLWLVVILALGLTGGCTSRPAPSEAAGLKSGNYLTRFSRPAEFQPEQEVFRVAVFGLEQVEGIDRELAGQIFQEELQTALAANGLRLDPEKATCTLEGQIHLMSLRTPFIRWLTGKSHADLAVSGAVYRNQEKVFVFQDEVAFTVPVAPRQPFLEPPLLARRAVRQFAHDLLNELLLSAPLQPQPSVREVPAPEEGQGVTADGG